MVNVVVLEGRLVADPEMRYTPQGIPVANFRIAVDRPFTNQDGTREADFLNVVAWRKLGEIVGNHLAKGRLVSVQGRLQSRQWEAQDGSKRTAYEVNADAVNFLGGKPKTAAETNEALADAEELPDDLPF